METKHTAADIVDILGSFGNDKHPRPIFALQEIEPVVENMLAYLRKTESSSLSFRDVLDAVTENSRIRILDSTNFDEYITQDLSPFHFGSSLPQTKPTRAKKRHKRPR